MSLLRIIARLDIKGPNVVKGIQMEGLRVVGKPEALASKYAQTMDELLYIDTVATLYGRNQLHGLLESTCEEVFIPITVGGGIKDVASVKAILRAGADKVAINTAAIQRPRLIPEVVDACGSQALVVSIEAKKTSGGWEAYTDNGRERTGRDAVKWAFEAVRLGAGEILLTSVDRDGTCKGMDVDLIRAVAPNVPVPVTACGGCGSVEHFRQALEAGRADAVAVGAALHRGLLDGPQMRQGGL